MERLAVFRLLPADRMLPLYEALSRDDKLFLLCACEPEAVAPFLEDQPPAVRALFPPPPKDLPKKLLERFK